MAWFPEHWYSIVVSYLLGLGLHEGESIIHRYYPNLMSALVDIETGVLLKCMQLAPYYCLIGD